MKYLILTLFLPAMSLAQTTEANYYRFWQGFKKAGLSDKAFKKELPSFMQDTVKLYKGKGLSNYLVVIPPGNKPSYVPDEFALVAFDSESSYRSVRATPEGQKYSDRHWDIFAKDTSKSANLGLIDDKATKLEENIAYNVLGKPVNWAQGFNFFHLGLHTKSKNVQKSLLKLASDLRQNKFGNKVNGVLLLTNDKYTAVFVNASDSQAIDSINAFLRKDLETLMSSYGEEYTNQKIEDDKLYPTLFPSLHEITCSGPSGELRMRDDALGFSGIYGELNPFSCYRDKQDKTFYSCESYQGALYAQFRLPLNISIDPEYLFKMNFEFLDENSGEIVDADELSCSSNHYQHIVI